MNRLMSSLAVALILCTTLFLSAPTASADFVGDWSARFGGMGIYSRGIKVDGNGNVYVLGQIRSGAGGKIVTIKYSPSGSMLWERQVDGTGGAFDIEVDGTGNAYITGVTMIYSVTSPQSSMIQMGMNFGLQFTMRLPTPTPGI
jgi:hypothetical protein